VDATSTSGTRRIDSLINGSGLPAAVAKEEEVYAREVMLRETQSREVGGDAGVPPNQGAMFSPHQETNTNPEILGDAGRSKSEASLDASKLLVVSMHGILTHQNRVGSKPHREVKRSFSESDLTHETYADAVPDSNDPSRLLGGSSDVNTSYIDLCSFMLAQC